MVFWFFHSVIFNSKRWEGELRYSDSPWNYLFGWREKGSYEDVSELESIIKSKFSDTAVCVGNPALSGSYSAVEVSKSTGREGEDQPSFIRPVQMTQPFPRVVSRSCPGYFRLAPGEAIDQTGGSCSYCQENLITADFPPTPPSLPRKRGRPISRVNKEPKTRQMSDTTKKKIAESIKTFSICKLCNKQCRGFRGLVDHMHRDHEDYKPWRCHICNERTAFVKTLYRHLKKEHGMSGGPCPVCGKIFSRAQSMLHHVNKVNQYLWPSTDFCKQTETNLSSSQKYWLSKHRYRSGVWAL